MSDTKETPQQVFDRVAQRLTEARQTLADTRGELQELLKQVTSARARGQINHRIWEIECAMGARRSFFSQSGQDAFLEERVFRGRRGGTFVEIGGYDGVTGSNCLFFELFRGWSGVLVEPSPIQHTKAAQCRRAQCLQVALADAPGEAEFLDIREGYSQMSGLTASYDAGLRKTVESDPRHKGELITVAVTTLPDILDARGMTEVDYVSLDVEGGEMAILSAFPFEKYDITAWTIENNLANTEISDLMQDRGYRRVEALGVDDVYVRAE